MVYVIIILIGSMILFYLASYRESNQLKLKDYEFHVPNLAEDQTLLFFSDVHIGKWYDAKHLPAIVMKIQEVAPDILILGGDFIDHYKRDEKRLDIDEICAVLSEIRVKEKFAVMGNHDHHVYENIMHRCGFRLLKNEQVKLQGVSIAGLDDYLCGRPDVAGMDFHDSRFHIAVVHEPDAVDTLPKEHIHLFLSGHTHGGQVGIPILKYLVLPKGGQHYLKGKYSLHDTCSLIVSSGIGRTGLPLRLGNPPELVRIRLLKN